MRKPKFVSLFTVILLVVIGIATGACDKVKDGVTELTAPTPIAVVVPQVYATATASANIFVSCENGTTVSVAVFGSGEAYAASYEEAKKIAEQRAQADLERAKAQASANVTVVCRSATTPTPTPAPIPTPPPPPPLVVIPPPPPTLVACTYAVVTTPLTMGYGGENGSTSIGTQDGCRWTASVDATWIEASPLSGVGNNSKIGLYAGPNPGPQRTATVAIVDQNGVIYRRIVTQAGRP